MWEEEGEVVNTRGVLKSFINKCNENDVYFESFEQNDASDFLNTYMDFLHDLLKEKLI